MSRTVTNIVFDLGNVLFHWDPVTVIESVFDKPTAQLIKKSVLTSHDLWHKMDQGLVTLSEAIPQFARMTGLNEKQIRKLMDAFMGSLTIKSDTLDLIVKLHQKGYPLYVLSNMSAEFWEYLFHKHDFWQLFTGITISAHVKLIKPDPKIYTQMLAVHDLKAENTLFIDDLQENVRIAENAGIQTILFSSVPQCKLVMTAMNIL